MERQEGQRTRWRLIGHLSTDREVEVGGAQEAVRRRGSQSLLAGRSLPFLSRERAFVFTLRQREEIWLVLRLKARSWGGSKCAIRHGGPVMAVL